MLVCSVSGFECLREMYVSSSSTVRVVVVDVEDKLWRVMIGD